MSFMNGAFVWDHASHGRGGRRFTGLKKTTTLDLNRLVTFPCALTNYVTCPLPPLRNRVPFAITAGEKLPSVHVEERIQTFHAQ